MAKPTTTTPTTLPYLLFSTAIVLAVLPPIGSQSPAPAPTPTMTAPSPGPDCSTSLLNLADCLTFVDVGSNLKKPDPSCCPEVSDLLGTQPVCLCELLANSTQLGFSNIDTNRALKLPPLCNISAPPTRLCAAIGVHVPGTAPVPSTAGRPSPGKGSPAYLLASNELFLAGLAVVSTFLLYYQS